MMCRHCGQREGRERWFITGPAYLPGQTVKLNAKMTFGCDECWQVYRICAALRFPR